MSETKEKQQRVTVVLTENQLQQLKRHLLYQSNLEGKRITISEGIRRAVGICYPETKQEDIFNGKGTL